MTVLEALVAADREADLIHANRELVGPGLPEPIVETFLVRAEGAPWRSVTIWQSRARARLSGRRCRAHPRDLGGSRARR